MKKRNLILIAIVLIALGVTTVRADTLAGWKIVFTLNGQRAAEIGASDYSSCYVTMLDASKPQSGIHIGIGPSGDFYSVTYHGTKVPLAETITMWNIDKTDFSGTLSWQWQSHGEFPNYQKGPKPANFHVHMTLITRRSNGEKSTPLDPSKGSIRINIAKGTFPAEGPRIVLSVTPAIKKSAKPVSKTANKKK